MWDLKNNTNESTYETNRLRHRKQTYDYQRGMWGDKFRVRDAQIHTATYKTDKPQGPTV